MAISLPAHDWQTFRQRTGREPRPDNEQALSLADFRARKIDGLFTPVDEQAIRDLLLQHPDMVLVTDKIDDFQKLAHAFPFPDRMVVEVFSPKSFLAARREGIQHPMLSVANLEMSYDFISSNAVRHVAVSTSELLRCPGAAAKLVESGVAVFSFTTNEAELMAKYLQSHVSAFYTDFWDVSAGRCSAESCTGDARASTSGGHVK
jgi:hypothetical protein